MRQKLTKSAIAVAKKLRLAWLLRKLVGLLPRRFGVAMEDRVYALRRTAGDATAHVAAEELEAELHAALRRLRDRLGDAIVGDYYEFGVYAGGTMLCFDRARRAAGLDDLRLFGFDSFEGLPPSAAEEAPGRFRPNMFACSADTALENLRRGGVDLERVSLIEGWFSDTLVPETRALHDMDRAAVIMLDCDLYSSAKAALDFCTPLLADHTVVICDDWVHGGAEGEQRAFAEWTGANGLVAEELGHYRAGGHPDGGRVFLVSRAT